MAMFLIVWDILALWYYIAEDVTVFISKSRGIDRIKISFSKEPDFVKTASPAHLPHIKQRIKNWLSFLEGLTINRGLEMELDLNIYAEMKSKRIPMSFRPKMHIA